MKFLEGEDYRQHFLFYLGVSRLSISQGTTGICNRFSFLQQGSSKTLLTCIALYDKLFFGVIVAQNGSRSHKLLNFFERFLLFFGPLPFSISSCQSPQGFHYVG